MALGKVKRNQHGGTNKSKNMVIDGCANNLHWSWIKNYFKSLLGFSRKTTNC